MITNLVGTRIRALRAERKMTQQQLSDLTDIPRATIASVERDDANPTLTVVHRIAVVLGVTVDELIVEEFQRVQLFEKEKMQRVEAGGGAYQATVVSPNNAPNLLQQLFRLAPNSRFEGKPHPPGSEEFLHMLGGECVLEVAGEETHLRPGDSARFGGNVHHLYSNPTNKESVGFVTILEKKS